MKRDAQATQARILEAATAEFAQYGIAGARIDRIAEASNSNKSMIYAYFTSKDELFNAVGKALINQSLHDVPTDVNNLPEYAARLFDQFQKHPEVLRLLTWDRLERGGFSLNIPEVIESNALKVAAIEQAQQQGKISPRFPARLLLELILSLAQTEATFALGMKDERARRRQAIRDAVERLVQD